MTRRVTGGCHCGRVRFACAVDTGDVVACNCSHCAAKGLLWAFAAPDDFAVTSGAEALVTYRFNTRRISHLFCGRCGVQPFGRGPDPVDGQDKIAINVRCLDGVDLASLDPAPFDGRSL